MSGMVFDVSWCHRHFGLLKLTEANMEGRSTKGHKRLSCIRERCEGYGEVEQTNEESWPHHHMWWMAWRKRLIKTIRKMKVHRSRRGDQELSTSKYFLLTLLKYSQRNSAISVKLYQSIILWVWYWSFIIFSLLTFEGLQGII